MAEQIKTRIAADEYFQLPEYAEHDLIQLIEGEVLIDMPPILRHQKIVIEIIFFLRTLVQTLGGEVYTSPAEVYLDEYNVYEPDVFYLKPNSSATEEVKRVVGAPDLVVEVLSPSTAKRDRQQKYLGYERHGVGEYWIVDPVHDTIEVWTNSGTSFIRQGAFGRDDTFDSAILGATVTVAKLIPTQA